MSLLLRLRHAHYCLPLLVLAAGGASLEVALGAPLLQQLHHHPRRAQEGATTSSSTNSAGVNEDSGEQKPAPKVVWDAEHITAFAVMAVVIATLVGLSFVRLLQPKSARDAMDQKIKSIICPCLTAQAGGASSKPGPVSSPARGVKKMSGPVKNPMLVGLSTDDGQNPRVS